MTDTGNTRKLLDDMDGFTVSQAAKALGVKRGHIDYLIRAGRIQWKRFGPLRVITSLAVEPPARKVGRPKKAA